MAFHRFILAIRNDKPIEVYGDGKQTRDYTYVEDIVQATVRAMETDVVGEAINIGGGVNTTLEQVICTLEDVMNRKAILIHTEKQKGDLRHTFADIQKAGEMLDYKPQVRLAEGLEKEAAWLDRLSRIEGTM